MKIAVTIPAKGSSNRCPGKNLREIAGKPLVRIAAEKLISSRAFNTIFIDTDSQDIWSAVEDLPVVLMQRPYDLATNATCGNKLMEWELDAGMDKYDIAFQFHCTSPLITPETIQNVVDMFCLGFWDSILTVVPRREYYWADQIPSYDLDNVPNSFDIKPVMQETHAMYGIKPRIFRKLRRRVGQGPLLYEVSEIEAYDINTEEDFRIVQCLGEHLFRDNLGLVD